MIKITFFRPKCREGKSIVLHNLNKRKVFDSPEIFMLINSSHYFGE